MQVMRREKDLGRARRRSPTSEFDALVRRALEHIDPRGSGRNHLVARRGAGGYQRGVRPDFILSDGRWVDFKLHVSYREKRGDVAWRPSALYTSLRKYIDHPENQRGTLTIIYRHLHGSIRDVEFPVLRGRTVLIADEAEFARKVFFVDVERVLQRLDGTPMSWIAERVRHL